MTSITPFLWFDNNVPEAVAFYKSVFPNAKVETVNDFMASFELEGQKFNALNGGPKYKFNEAVSFFISVETQEQVDYFWSKLTADGGEELHVRMAQGQVRPVLAGGAHGAGPLPQRSRSHQGRSRHAGHDEDAKDRHRRSRQGFCRLMPEGRLVPSVRSLGRSLVFPPDRAYIWVSQDDGAETQSGLQADPGAVPGASTLAA